MTDLVTDPQKTKLRADVQGAQVFAIIDSAPTIFSCRVNQTFDTHDMVASFTYDGASGTYADVLPDMTVLVGSAAGLSDLGMRRARKAWGAATAYVGEGSEIDWDDDLYITVIDDFGIWARHIRPVAGVFYADYDVAYSDQHTTRDPLIILGGDRVAELTGASVAVAFSASNGLGGTTTWAWTSTGGTITGPTTATPSIAFTTAGRYRVTATATSSGKSFARHVFVHVLGTGYLPLSEFVLNNVDSESGTVASITAYDGVDAIRDMTRVIIFERAWYQNTLGSVGVVTGMENIIMTGFVSGESIEYHPDTGYASFDIENAFYWLERLAQYPSGIEDTTGTASAWTNINGLTVDKAIWHLAHWRSTLSRIMDVVLSGDARQCAKLAEGTGSLGGQMKSSAAAILAEIAVDRYGRLHVQIPHNLVPQADRTTPTIMTLTDADIQAGIKMSAAPASQTAQVDLSGVAYSSGSGLALFSLSPGHVFNRFGSVVNPSRLALTNQTQSNELAGLLAGRANNKNPEITLTFAGVNRVFDTAPQGLAALTISAAQSPRGVGYTGNAIPRRISYQHDALTGILTTQVTFETETFAEPSVTGDTPVEADYPPDADFPSMPGDPPDISFPPLEPIGEIRAIVLHCWSGIYVTYDVQPTGTTTWHSLNDDIILDDSLAARMIIQMSVHRTGTGLLATSPSGVYFAQIVNSTTPAQLTKIMDYDKLNLWCPYGAGLGVNTYYGVAVDPLTGAMFVCGGNNSYYDLDDPDSPQPESIVARSLNYGVSWTLVRPSSPPGAYPPGELDHFWGYAKLRHATADGGLFIAQAGDGGETLTATFMQYFQGGYDTILLRVPQAPDTDTEFGRGNAIHHRVGYGGSLIYFLIPNYGNVTKQLILETFGSTPTLSTTSVPVAQVALSGAENVRIRNVRNMLAFDPLGQAGLISGYDGYFWRSVDGGDNWAQDVLIPNDGTPPNYNGDGLGKNPCIASPTPGVWLAAANWIGPTSPTRKYGKVMMSTDGGATWSDKTGNLYDIGAADIVPAGNNQGLSAYKIDFFYGAPESV